MSAAPTFQTEPRWPAFVALVAVGFLYMGLPETLSVGPRWLLLVVILALLVPMTIAHRLNHIPVLRMLIFTANGLITAAMIAAIAFLIQGLPAHRESSGVLLRSAVGLWLTNILVFALWYWKLDAGGPHERERSRGNLRSAFLFPQMMQQGSSRDDSDDRKARSFWYPHFVDYLFLAFNTSTAFSPTDTAVLSRGAKLGMMAQAIISLTILVLLAARAVNIL